MTIKPGLHLDITNEDYHAAEGISSSFLKKWATSTPAHATAEKELGDSPALQIGTAVHAMVLEPEKDLVLEGPDNRRGKVWTEFKEQAAFLGKTPLTSGDFARCKAMADALMSNTECASLLTDKDRICEASVFSKDKKTKQIIKARPDLYIQKKKIVVDVKTCQDASPSGFPKQLHNLNYFIQAAFYKKVLEIEKLPVEKFVFLCVEKEPPYACLPHILDKEYMEIGMSRVEHTLEEIMHCRATKIYPTGWPKVNIISPPNWD
tara:strand:- start:1525 stop:2313 length:789 start_codon:yes stop_codon:yes gene_type:complete